MIILGIDPGFAALGLATYETDVGFIDVDCIHTKKQGGPAGVDLFERCEFIAAQFEDLEADILCVETLTHPPSASSATKLGASHGVIAAASNLILCPEVVALCTALAARKVVTGLKKPTEDEAHDAVRALYPELADMLVGWRKVSVPHVLDAAVQVAAYLKEVE